jgi:hypothetical protein
MIDGLCAELEARGRFDTIVLDWVLNSVDSQEAEDAVLGSCAALLKPGGRIWMTGRQREWGERLNESRTFSGQRRGVEFLDADGLSALRYHSRWFYQKFHSQGEIERQARRYFGGPTSYTQVAERWRVRAEKALERPWSATMRALRFAFDLPWPDGHTVGRGEQAVAAVSAAIARERG